MSILLAFLALGCQDSAPTSFDPAITRADLEACIAFLASDELLGRMTGTPECARAGDFLAEGLARAGVRPAGDDGTYRQPVPLLWTEFKTAPKLTLWRADGTSATAVQGTDFDWYAGVPSAERLQVQRVTRDEELPARADAAVALFLDGSSIERRRWLGESGGAGYGLVLAPAPSDKPTPERTEPPPPRRQLAESGTPEPAPQVRVRGALLEGLRAGTIVGVAVEAEVVREQRPTFNVVGRIDGVGTRENPGLAKETIVFSAHYDHIGTSEREGGEDTIENGADDDASGCAAVLELAEAFAAGPAPARTLLFFFATGEEIGLVGTNWYLANPLEPLEQTVCNLNFEMIGRPDELAGGPGKLWLTGDERSNLGAEFRALGLPVVVDPRPSENFFQRSDNFAFALRGIVAQTLSSYNLHTDYHHVTDEIGLIDFEHMQASTRVAYEAARALADGRVTPRWNEGGKPERRGR